jgi:hypothetical protein
MLSKSRKRIITIFGLLLEIKIRITALNFFTNASFKIFFRPQKLNGLLSPLC